MDHRFIIDALDRNAATIESLFSGIENELMGFRYAPGKWNLLEVACHLVDEERHDFRARVRHILKTPSQPMPPIDPAAWVEDHDYANQDFSKTTMLFIEERRQSVTWLRNLENPAWNNVYTHPKFGEWTAGAMLANWLAHDYLHFRQIVRIKYEFLRNQAGNTGYAGDW